MTRIEHLTQQPSLESRMSAWGEQYRAKRGELVSMARAAFAFYVEWHTAGASGDFCGTLAQHSGLSRTTAWRVYRAGFALQHGADPNTDLMDLVEAARAFDGGATADEVNKAIAADRVKDLANKLSTGTVGRQMDADVAELREQVLTRLGNLGMEHVKPKERELVVYRSFLAISDETARQIIEAHRAMTEG